MPPLRPWWEALREVFWPFVASRVFLAVVGAAMALGPGVRDDFGHVSHAGSPADVGLGEWLWRVLVAPWRHYDVLHYVDDIAARGYDAKTAAFYPVHPLTIRAAAAVIGDPMIAAMLLNVAWNLGSAVLLFRLAEELGERAHARSVAIALLWSPLAFVLAIPYSEAPYLFFSLLALRAGLRKEWVIAGAAAAVAAGVRQPGIALLPALGAAYLLWAAREAPDWRARASGLALGLVPVIPFAYTAWLVRQGFVDVNPLSPTAPFAAVSQLQSEHWRSTFVMPWTLLAVAAERLRSEQTLYIAIDVVGSLVGAVLAVWGAVRWPRVALVVYVGLVVFLSFTKLETVAELTPMLALPRRLSILPTTWVLLGVWMGRHGAARIVYWSLSPLLLVLLTTLFVWNSWTP